MSKFDPFTILGTTEKIDKPTIENYTQSRWQGDEYMPDRSTGGSAGLTIPKSRFIMLSVLIGLSFSFIVIRIIGLQLVSGADYRDRAENNRIKLDIVTAPRGIIYDRNGVALVENKPNFVLTLNINELPDGTDGEKVLNELSELSGISLTDINKLIDESNDETIIEIRNDIGYDEALMMRLSLADRQAISLDVKPVRDYMSGEAYAHVLGYMSKISPEELEANKDSYQLTDYIGKDGLEKQYETYLKGIDGGKQIERDSRNLDQRVIASVDPIAGHSLTTTIDSTLQQVLYDALANTVEKNRDATGGAAVAIDPRSGAILALISYPSFNNDTIYQGTDSEYVQSIFNDERTPLFNRAIAAKYPPGSTFKPLVASAALQEGVISSNTTVLSTGGIRIDKWYFPDWKGGGHGVTDVRKAIAESVNTFFYTIGGGTEDFTGLGVDRISQYASRFGFGQPLGIDLPNESDGFLPSKDWKESTKNESWYIGDTYHLAIGQGDVLATPLQIASSTATIANGGTIYKPHLIKEVIDNKGEIVEKEQITTIAERVISPITATIVREGMRQAVTSGSSRAINTIKVLAAGKTGTAQTSKDTTHAWFTSFAPYDSPEIVITVVVEHGGEGHIAALPIAKAGLQAYFNQ